MWIYVHGGIVWGGGAAHIIREKIIFLFLLPLPPNSSFTNFLPLALLYMLEEGGCMLRW